MAEGEFIGALAAGMLAKVAAKAVDAPKAAKGAAKEGGVTSEGTANAATYPLLKEQLANENLANIAAQDVRLAAAVKGEARMGAGTVAEANQLGQTWVGDGAKLVDNQASCPGCMKSADGLRIYRPPSFKPNTPVEFNPTGVQANFVQLGAGGKIISNSHLVVLP
jgi:filamentous hemagglutinin